MSVFFPSIYFKRIYMVTPKYLKQNGITTLLLDVDNTLTSHGSQELAQEIADWLNNMKKENIKMAVVSNNVDKRVKPFAQKIGLPYMAFCCKPSPFGLIKSCKMLGVKKDEVALVGDQIFTDILAANFYNIKSILVQPMKSDYQPTIRFKRFLEKFIISAYFKKGNKMIESD